MAGTQNNTNGRFQDVEEIDERLPLDWVKARLDYETGLLSPLELSRKFQVSTQAIYKRRRVEGWNKSLNKSVRGKTSILIAEDLVNSELEPGEQVDAQRIVNAAAEIQYEKIKKHREDFDRLEAIIERHMSTLETGSYSMLDADGSQVTAIIDVQESTKLLAVVARAMAQKVGLERQSYGMDSDEDDRGNVIQVSLDLGLASSVPEDEKPDQE